MTYPDRQVLDHRHFPAIACGPSMGGSTTCPDPLERRTGRWAGDHSHTGMTLNPPRDQSLQDPRGGPPLTARTNRVIGGRAPSDYLERLANSAKVDRDTISKHVSTHLADAGVMAQDDFEAFFAARARALLDQIASATGKAIDDLDLTNAAGTEGPEAADDL